MKAPALNQTMDTDISRGLSQTQTSAVKEGDEGIIDLQIQLNGQSEDGKNPVFKVDGVGNIDKQPTEEGENNPEGINDTALTREGDLDQINEQPGEEGEQKPQGEEGAEGEGEEEGELNQDILNENS